MENQSKSTIDNDEQKIMTIVQKLPPECKSQVLAFARFLAFETFQTTDLDFLKETNLKEDYTEADSRWDKLLASEEGQRVIDKLSDEALAEIRAGNAKSVIITKEGEMAPQ